MSTVNVNKKAAAKMNLPVKINVCCKNIYFEVSMQGLETVHDLREAIFKNTRVEPSKQVLFLNSKEIPNDNTPLQQLKLTSDSVVMLTISAIMPSTAAIPEASAAANLEESVPGPSKQTHKARTNKLLAVLDIDGTIYDHEALATSALRAQRPYLQELLGSIDDNYDIIFWSATDMDVIEEKLDFLNISCNPHYKILRCLDRGDMVLVSFTDGSMGYVKSLEVVWKKHPEYNKKNTIICDDMDINLQSTKENGLLVKTYSYKDYDTDRELQLLAKYLKNISSSSDLSTIDHTKWRSLAK